MDSADAAGLLGAATCVVVDDHLEMLGAIKETLESAGVTVVAVASAGDAALKAIRAAAPDAAVVDYELPDMTGLELVARGRWLSARTSFVLHSARLDADTVADALAAGVRGVVLKNTPTRLVEALATVLAGEVYVDPALESAETARPRCR
jgi:DNA-binding NarL/FixJ family response regulator